jgi:co-chaperonin GroES (HSP10)
MIAPSKTKFLALAFCVATTGNVFVIPLSAAGPAPQEAAPSAVTRRIGAVKAINGTAITLTPDSGSDLNVTVQPTTRIVRIAPGEKDLKNATQIQLQDVQVGDRVLVGGKLSDDKLSLAASSVVVMKKSDLQARDQQTLQDWQKRGVDGLAGAADASAGTISITSKGKSVVIHTSGTTVIRRYPPDSVKFEDAKPGTLQEIHPGDQVRARGDRNADGTDLSAEEIVSGTFRNFAGTINSVDASSSTLSVHDLLSKKNVTIKVTADSQLRKLPPEMAQMMAKRLKGAAAGAMAGAASGSSAGDQHAASANAPGATGGNGGHSGGPPDLQRLISHAPAVSLADLQKGDAVVILSTEGTASGAGTAITLVSGVEPILQAAPNAGQAMMLAPWSLGAPAGDSGGP